MDANSCLARNDLPDFNDPNKLGEGYAMVKRLENLLEKLRFQRNLCYHAVHETRWL